MTAHDLESQASVPPVPVSSPSEEGYCGAPSVSVPTATCRRRPGHSGDHRFVPVKPAPAPVSAPPSEVGGLLDERTRRAIEAAHLIFLVRGDNAEHEGNTWQARENREHAAALRALASGSGGVRGEDTMRWAVRYIEEKLDAGCEDADVLSDVCEKLAHDLAALSSPASVPPGEGEPGIQRVQQDDPKGCAVACLAMVAGRDYADVREAIPALEVAQGVSDRTVLWWLNREGYFHRRYWTTGADAKPIPSRGLALALTTDAHWIVLHNGVALDPARPVPLAFYPITQVIEVQPPDAHCEQTCPSWDCRRTCDHAGASA